MRLRPGGWQLPVLSGAAVLLASLILYGLLTAGGCGSTPTYRHADFEACIEAGGDPAACHRRATMKAAAHSVVEPERDNELLDNPAWVQVQWEIHVVLSAGEDRLAESLLMEMDPEHALAQWQANLAEMTDELHANRPHWRCLAWPKECGP